MGGGRYEIVLTKVALEHIRALGKKHRSLVLETLRQQLTLDPFSETRNRKPLSLPAPFGAHWELRFGPQNRFRVFYTLEPDRRAVLVVAVGTKVRKRLLIAGKEI